MRFEALQRRVERAESLVEGRMQATQCQWDALKLAWKQGWTPTRIVVAGLVGGFLVGRAEPLRSVTGTRWLQMITSISGLVASLQSAAAAQQAETAAESAEETAEQAASGETAAATPAAPLRDAHPDTVSAPRPAEAATELSER